MSEFLRVGDKVRVLNREELKISGYTVKDATVFNAIMVSNGRKNCMINEQQCGKIGVLKRGGYSEMMEIEMEDGSKHYYPHWVLVKVHTRTVDSASSNHKPSLEDKAVVDKSSKYVTDAIDELKRLVFDGDKPAERYKNYIQINRIIYEVITNLVDSDTAYEFTGVLFDALEEFHTQQSNRMYKSGYKAGAREALHKFVDDFVDGLNGEEE